MKHLLDPRTFVAFSHSRAILPWHAFARRQDPSSRLHRLALETEKDSRAHGLLNQLLACVWLVPVLGRQILIAWKAHGDQARQRHGTGHFRQLLDLLVWVFRFNHPAQNYYLQQAALRPRRSEWVRYIDHVEHQLLNEAYLAKVPADHCSHKLRLFRTLRHQGVPTIEVILAATAGEWENEPFCGLDSERLKCDLVVKPAIGYISEGVQNWRYDPASETYTYAPYDTKNVDDRFPPDRRVTLREVLDHVLASSKAGTLIVQPWMKNAANLREIAPPQDLVNFRIVTVMSQGQSHFAGAIARLPYNRFRWEGATYLANIDPESGTLGDPTGRTEFRGTGPRHFDTSVMIAGFKLQNWDAMKALALRAHTLFPEFPSIGWDVIDTTEGPMIMEANVIWGADISQVAGPFLGDTKYPEAVLEAHERVRGGR